MKLFKTLVLFISCITIISCSSDSDDNSEYPITLNYNRVEDSFLFYQNGNETDVPTDVLDYYYNTDVAISIENLEADYGNDYFMFLSDTELELKENGETFTVNYAFENGYLFLIDTDDNKYLYGKGDKTKLEYLIASGISVYENGSSAYRSSFEDEGDIDYFPATFENHKDWHNYNSIEEVQGDNYVLFHNVSIVYE
ncbi:hypothetical protein [Neotamlana laminarinivorans]|uniref:DKNYY family protein n=1 Tax=Neotamlana laminarinivorans TaxID=2883124 RepID=A0A9X1I435_9FLAO|nr:hypothetical protein [Tamlana laminarinivorans]MCB4800062.1 hypothetical protein [Tamlana laminarinivorans]